MTQGRSAGLRVLAAAFLAATSATGASAAESRDLGPCRVGAVLNEGQYCSHKDGGTDLKLSVTDGKACIRGNLVSGSLRMWNMRACSTSSERLRLFGFAAIRQSGRWTVRSLPRRASPAGKSAVGKSAAGKSAIGRRMQARTRSNMRAGPGTKFRRVGILQAGQEVRVTGRAGAWLRIAAPGGGMAFVHGSLLVAPDGRSRAGMLDRGGAAGPSPKCARMRKGVNCWQELANRPGCHIFRFNHIRSVTITWSGRCTGGVAVGPGMLEAKASSASVKATGTLVRGRVRGRWVRRHSDGTVAEGPVVNGEPHGKWVIRRADGSVGEGPYVRGTRQGKWVVRYSDGNVLEGPVVDGQRHGKWVARQANGTVQEGPYVRGKRHGRWIIRFAGGSVNEGPYADGKKNGKWVERHVSGTVQEGRYWHGKRHGKWVVRTADGRCGAIMFSSGKRLSPTMRC